MTNDTSNSTDGLLSECDHQRFERNHYFHGKLMTARDMAAEQAYHVRQRRAHARSVAGSGVAWGLDVTVADDGPDALSVTVDKGYAVDECGRPVVVPQEYTKTITDSKLADADAVVVWVRYEACLKESVPVDGAESACENECAYNRVLEVYDVAVKEADADPSATAPDDPSSVEKSVPDVDFPERSDYSISGREQPGVADPELATIAESYRTNAGMESAGSSDSQLYLGTFTPGGDDKPAWKQDPTQPTPHVYTNDMLYSAIARHAADFGNPHQVSLTTEDDGKNAAIVRILDDQSDHPDVTLGSSDETVAIAHESTQTIDLSIEPEIKELQNRIRPLERYAMEKALKYSGIVFRDSPDWYSSEAVATASDIAAKARRVSDARLEASSNAAAAAKLEIEDEDAGIDRTIEGDVYEKLLEEFRDLEKEFLNQVSGQATDESVNRLKSAYNRLKSVLDEKDPAMLAMAAAQDDVVDTVQWLEEGDTGPAGSASFRNTIYELDQGDIAELTVDLSNTDEATLVIGSTAANYKSTVDLADKSGDGTVAIRMNTYRAGRFGGEESKAFATVNDADEVEATLETNPLSSVLATADYDLKLTVDGRETDVSSLIVNDRSTDLLTAQRASSNAYTNGLKRLSDVYDRQNNDSVTDMTKAVPGETLVFEVAATGIFGALAAQSGSDMMAIDALDALVNGPACNIELIQSDADTAKRLNLKQSADDGMVRAFADQAKGRLFLVVDSEGATFEQSGNPTPVSPGEAYEATFVLSGNDPLTDSEETVSDTFEFVEATGKFHTNSNGVVTVKNAANESITGQTNLAPGTKPTVRARSTGAQPFLKTANTTVQPDGQFEGIFNFSGVDPDTEFKARFSSVLLTFDTDAIVEST